MTFDTVIPLLHTNSFKSFTFMVLKLGDTNSDFIPACLLAALASTALLARLQFVCDRLLLPRAILLLLCEISFGILAALADFCGNLAGLPVPLAVFCEK